MYHLFVTVTMSQTNSSLWISISIRLRRSHGPIVQEIFFLFLMFDFMQINGDPSTVVGQCKRKFYERFIIKPFL